MRRIPSRVLRRLRPAFVSGRESCLVEAASVRHEATDGAAREKLSRHAAEDQLAEPAMSIAARDQKVRVLLFGDSQQLFSAGSLLLQQYFGSRLDAMLGQVTGNVLKSPQRRSLFARPTRLDHDDLGCLLQKRYRITHGATGLASVFPTDNDTLSAQSAVRHHPAPDVPASEPPRRRR